MIVWLYVLSMYSCFAGVFSLRCYSSHHYSLPLENLNEAEEEKLVEENSSACVIQSHVDLISGTLAEIEMYGMANWTYETVKEMKAAVEIECANKSTTENFMHLRKYTCRHSDFCNTPEAFVRCLYLRYFTRRETGEDLKITIAAMMRNYFPPKEKRDLYMSNIIGFQIFGGLTILFMHAIVCILFSK
ncbi:hypothetical protein RB195_020698 [Necator americanus]|uniref:Uncharacterized protein n=1 Tax=Necator americanus TaxID=51031 RepID=A0ABR1CK23_NECAM